MLVAYYNQQGKLKEDKFKLNDDVFKAKVNKVLLTLAVQTYWANQRQSNADTKDRGDVSGGGKKPWRQKGTGRARVGSSRSPIWKGGGVTFGPSNIRNYTKKISKTMRQAAIKGAFSYLAAKDAVVVYEGIKLGDKPKTKDLLKVLKDFQTTKTLLIQPDINVDLFNAAQNLENLNLEVINELNVVKLLDAEKVIILEPALVKIYEFWGSKAKKVKAEPVKKESK